MRPRLSHAGSSETLQNATYVYCLVQSGTAPATGGVPHSVPGAGPVRLLPIDGGVWAVVADAPLRHFSGEALQQEMQDVETISRHALAHASVTEFFFRRAPVIPLKLFTLFSSDQRVREHVRGRLPALKRMFARLRGHEEWGVRVLAADAGAETAPTAASGRDYLQVKKRLHDESRAPSRAVVRTANGAIRSLGRLAVKTRHEKLPPPGRGRPYATAASFLVKSSARRKWTAHASRLEAALAAQGHRLDVSGPWPPYHFVSK